MSQADSTHTKIPLSRLTSDPVLRAFFERGEHLDIASAVPAPRKAGLFGGVIRRVLGLA